MLWTCLLIGWLPSQMVILVHIYHPCWDIPPIVVLLVQQCFLTGSWQFLLLLFLLFLGQLVVCCHLLPLPLFLMLLVTPSILIILFSGSLLIIPPPPASKVWGVYRNHPVRPSVRSSVRIYIHGLSGYLLLQFWSYSCIIV